MDEILIKHKAKPNTLLIFTLYAKLYTEWIILQALQTDITFSNILIPSTKLLFLTDSDTNTM